MSSLQVLKLRSATPVAGLKVEGLARLGDVGAAQLDCGQDAAIASGVARAPRLPAEDRTHGSGAGGGPFHQPLGQ